MSLGTHAALVIGALIGVSAHYQRLGVNRGVRDLADAVINFDLAEPAEAAPEPEPPAPEPVVMAPVAPPAPSRRGHTLARLRPAAAAAPIRLPLDSNPLDEVAVDDPPVDDEPPAPSGSVPAGSGAGPSSSAPSATFASPQAPEPISISAGEAGYLRTYESYPSLPRSLWVWGRVYSIIAEVCVSAEGRVSNVSIKRSADPELDRVVAGTMRSWRYRPRLVAGVPRPFCHLMKLDFSLR
jgi:TonB family protein